MEITESVARRFWKMTKVAEGCWEWMGYKDRAGYGTMWIGGAAKMAKAHRVSLAIAENFGVHPTTMQKVLWRYTWKHI